MKAAVFNTYTGPVEIIDVPVPELAADSVLIDVHAASINPIDNILREGYLKDMIPLTFPHVMGYDVSGVITAVGTDVTGFKTGDAVFARAHQEDAGALAEVASVKASALALKPANLSHLEAASIPLVGLTAWQALIDKADLKHGQKVLIHAGSGGVGTLAIQIAKYLGALVATTVSARNSKLVSSLGADVVIDYKEQDFTEVIADYDVVFDMSGGEVMENSFKVLKKGGHLVSIKGQDTDDLATKYGVSFDWFFMEPNGDQLTKLADMTTKGTLKPVIDSTYAFTDAAKAYDKLAEGHAVGKIVIDMKAA
ncbi:NADP-dependent oxidoreductase [Ahrensia kielensis]|uniref:NADP-dependent oxidoreductase n=1 Tax=Ahrensia kielensis TaxID=76980 RepID=A0ABU9T2P4_9HYPH